MRDWGEEEEVDFFEKGWNFVTESKPMAADPSKPSQAPTHPPVPGPNENQSSIFESQHAYISSRNVGIDPKLQTEIFTAAFKQAEASANGELPKKGFLDPLKDMSPLKKKSLWGDTSPLPFTTKIDNFARTILG